jgi:superfamily II DNA or RNA helicase
MERGKRVLFLAPRRELIEQASEKLETFGVKHGVVMAGLEDRINLYAGVQVASFDTLFARSVRRQKLPLPKADLVLIDESHLSLSRQRAELIRHYRDSDAVVVGLTATPARGNGKGLGAIYDALVETATIKELQAAGHLVPKLRVFAPSKPDLDGVKVARGDYVVSQLERRMQPLLGDVVANWHRIAPDKRTVVFCVNRKHSIYLAEQFQQRGISAEHVDGATPLEDRKAIFSRVRSGQTQVLCNVFVASYGLDIPQLDCCVIARPTRSIPLFLQMSGRVLRALPGKQESILIDHGGVIDQLGLPDAEMSWSLDDSATIGERNEARRKKEPKEIACGECGAVYQGQRYCPECGHEPVMRGKNVETHQANLQEVGTHKAKQATMAEKADFYGQLLGYAQQKCRKPGWAAHQYRAKFGVWPNHPRIKNARPTEPKQAVLGWIISRNIAYAKRRVA